MADRPLTPGERWARLTGEQRAEVRAAWPDGLPGPKACVTAADVGRAHASMDGVLGFDETAPRDVLLARVAQSIVSAGLDGDEMTGALLAAVGMGRGAEVGDLDADTLGALCRVVAGVARGTSVVEVDEFGVWWVVPATVGRLRGKIAADITALHAALTGAGAPWPTPLRLTTAVGPVSIGLEGES